MKPFVGEVAKNTSAGGIDGREEPSMEGDMGKAQKEEEGANSSYQQADIPE